jgi:hypothetical protein
VVSIGQETVEFADFLGEIKSDWGSKLLANPACIWEEVSAFSPSRFLVKTAAIDVKLLLQPKEGDDSVSKKRRAQSCIKRVSRTTEDSRHVIVLTIWPPA